MGCAQIFPEPQGRVVQNEFEKKKRQSAKNKYVPLNYGYGDYTGYGIPEMPNMGAGDHRIDYSTNDPSTDTKDLGKFFKDKNEASKTVSTSNKQQNKHVSGRGRPRKV